MPRVPSEPSNPTIGRSIRPRRISTPYQLVCPIAPLLPTPLASLLLQIARRAESRKQQQEGDPAAESGRISPAMMPSASDEAAAAALELQESGWEELRREARKLEGDLDVKLSSYARLAARSSSAADASSASSPSERSSWKSMEFEIQSLLDKLQDVNDAMSRCAASTAPTTSVSQKLARHRDILHEFAQEFRRTRGNLSSIREHADLLSSVRDDITESKATGGMSPRVHLLRERASIHGSINQIDEVIGQAQSTRVALSNQRALFGDVQGKVKQLGEKFPVIRGLLGAIKRKKSKDTIILSAVIAACTIFLIIYWLSK
uniref:Golgi SNAP receptor complex member 1 n=1 Tax=Oryza meridionalis TaxID=40149 RepID=A0A0E0CEU7_9ORYZ